MGIFFALRRRWEGWAGLRWAMGVTQLWVGRIRGGQDKLRKLVTGDDRSGEMDGWMVGLVSGRGLEQGGIEDVGCCEIQ